MNINFDELNEWCDDAMRGLRQKTDRWEEEGREINSHMRALEAMKSLGSKMKDMKEELERKQEEIDDLEAQLEQRDSEIDDLKRQLEAETGDLRQQLLEAKNLHLESEKQSLEAEVHAKPREIHNHFEPGSSAQVFNAKVSGKFIKNKDKNDKKDKKKRWKKIARKIL